MAAALERHANNANHAIRNLAESGRPRRGVDDLEALYFLDNISVIDSMMALRMICMDDIGKEAVRDAPTLVRLETVNDNSELQISFTGGVPEMHYNYARTDCMYGGWRDSRAAEDDSSGDTRLSP
ncbi:MAG: hypothetical protein ABI625_20610 [bacterium]